jgi:hypothetical protein
MPHALSRIFPNPESAAHRLHGRWSCLLATLLELSPCVVSLQNEGILLKGYIRITKNKNKN